MDPLPSNRSIMPAGPVPEVDAGDLRRIWDMFRDCAACVPDQQHAIGLSALKVACGPGADVAAVWYRTGMLYLMFNQLGLLSEWVHDGQLDDVVLNVAAKFPMQGMDAGVVYNGLPLNIEDFVSEIRKRDLDTKK